MGEILRILKKGIRERVILELLSASLVLTSYSQRINSGAFLVVIWLASFKPHLEGFLPFLCELAKLKHISLGFTSVNTSSPYHCKERSNLDGE